MHAWNAQYPAAVDVVLPRTISKKFQEGSFFFVCVCVPYIHFHGFTNMNFFKWIIMKMSVRAVLMRIGSPTDTTQSYVIEHCRNVGMQHTK